MSWTLLILSLPTDNATSRMRAWRALKSLGAAVLRDGVYLMPARNAVQPALREIVEDVRHNGGSAHLLQADGADSAGFASLFDRTQEFGELIADIGKARASLSTESVQAVLKQTRKLRKSWAQLVVIDFFPGEAQRQAEAALLELESLAQRALSPDEPQPVVGAIERLSADAYQGRLWATRARPWVDRLASAWLIRRCIDPAARFLWLDHAADCPPDALGFDFDQATFTHVGARVTFETLLASFGLEEPALQRVGTLVHYLDVGGVPPAEASGVERVLAGLREAITDDDQLLLAAGSVLDGLLAGFKQDTTP